MSYPNPAAPPLPPQSTLPAPARSLRGLRIAVLLIATLVFIMIVASQAPGALDKARASYPQPVLGQISASQGTTISISQPVQFMVQVIAGRDLSYFWDFGDGSSSSDASPTHQFTTYGNNIQVTVQVTDPFGKSASQSITLALLNL